MTLDTLKKRTCIMVMRIGSTSMWRFSMEIIATLRTPTSLVVVIRAHERINIFAFVSFASGLWDLNIICPRSMNLLQGNTSSITLLGKFLNTHPYLMVTTTGAIFLYSPSMHGLDEAFILYRKLPIMDAASLKWIRKVMIRVFTIQMDACTLKLTGELMIQVLTI